MVGDAHDRPGGGSRRRRPVRRARPPGRSRPVRRRAGARGERPGRARPPLGRAALGGHHPRSAAPGPASALRGARQWLYVGRRPDVRAAGPGDGWRPPTPRWRVRASCAVPTWTRSGVSQRSTTRPSGGRAIWPPSSPTRACSRGCADWRPARELAKTAPWSCARRRPSWSELARLLPGRPGRGVTGGSLRRRAPAERSATGVAGAAALGERAPESRAASLTAGDTPARFALERIRATAGGCSTRLGAAKPLRDFSGEGTVLLVTWLDDRSFGQTGAYTDPHLGPLGTMLAERGLRVARLVKVLLHRPVRARRARAARQRRSRRRSRTRTCQAQTGGRASSASARLNAGDPRLDPESAALPFARLAREYASEHVRAQVDALSHEAAHPAHGGGRRAVRSGSCSRGRGMPGSRC